MLQWALTASGHTVTPTLSSSKICLREQDEDEEGQGTLTFGKRKELATYDGMDEEEKAIWKVGINAATP